MLTVIVDKQVYSNPCKQFYSKNLYNLFFFAKSWLQLTPNHDCLLNAMIDLNVLL